MTFHAHQNFTLHSKAQESYVDKSMQQVWMGELLPSVFTQIELFHSYPQMWEAISGVYHPIFQQAWVLFSFQCTLHLSILAWSAIAWSVLQYRQTFQAPERSFLHVDQLVLLLGHPTYDFHAVVKVTPWSCSSTEILLEPPPAELELFHQSPCMTVIKYTVFKINDCKSTSSNWWKFTGSVTQEHWALNRLALHGSYLMPSSFLFSRYCQNSLAISLM